MADRNGSYDSYGSSRSTSSSTSFGSARASTYLGRSTSAPSAPPPSSSSYGTNTQSSAYHTGANEIRGADIIAEYLVKEKVPYILGYAGHGAIGLLDGLYKQTDRIRHISPRIEQSAGFMADVYYRLTGQPLAVYASTGPGPMNLMISVANAYYDQSAFFVITGNVPTNQFDTGALQDDYRYNGDMSSIFAPVTKKSWRIRKVEDLVKALPDAFSLMRTGRPGPVHFDMPYDLYMRTAAVSTPEPNVHGSPLNWRTTVADETVEKALTLLTSAQRPLILAGGGVRVARAYEELKALAEQLDIPVYTSFMGKSVLPADHRLHLGVAGVWGEYPATEAVRNADVILAIGARFNDLHTGSWLQGYVYNIPPTRLIQVDIDPQEIGRNYPVEIGMVGDAKAFLGQAARIARAKGLRGGYNGAWQKEIEGWRTDWRNFCEPFERSSEVPIEPRRMMADMNRISPPDTVMVDDVGNCQVWIGAILEAARPRQSPDRRRLRRHGFWRRRRARRAAGAAEFALRDAVRRRRFHDDAACGRDRGRIQSARRVGAAEQLRDRHHSRPAALLSRRPRARHQLHQRAHRTIVESGFRQDDGSHGRPRHPHRASGSVRRRLSRGDPLQHADRDRRGHQPRHRHPDHRHLADAADSGSAADLRQAQGALKLEAYSEPSCPRLSRASTSLPAKVKTWMAGTSPAMTRVWVPSKSALQRYAQRRCTPVPTA